LYNHLTLVLQGNKVNVNSINVTKERVNIGTSVSSSIVNRLVRGSGVSTSSGIDINASKKGGRHPVLDEVVKVFYVSCLAAPLQGGEPHTCSETICWAGHPVQDGGSLQQGRAVRGGFSIRRL